MKIAKPFALCHPDRPYHAKNMCRQCYTRTRLNTEEGRRKSRERIARWRAGKGADYFKRHWKSMREQCATRPRPDNCEACGAYTELVWDHDHLTGAFRGWLCPFCNRTLGCAKDDVSRLEKLAQYLRDQVLRDPLECVPSGPTAKENVCQT